LAIIIKEDKTMSDLKSAAEAIHIAWDIMTPMSRPPIKKILGEILAFNF
jgi:hypothetical protein